MTELANTKLMLFTIIMGPFLSTIPYTSHRITPEVYIMYLNKDRSLVDLVLQLLMICGIIDTNMRSPATYPMISINGMAQRRAAGHIYHLRSGSRQGIRSQTRLPRNKKRNLNN
jgi:hypothetical protein